MAILALGLLYRCVSLFIDVCALGSIAIITIMIEQYDVVECGIVENVPILIFMLLVNGAHQSSGGW